jgi:hypothetical protein
MSWWRLSRRHQRWRGTGVTAAEASNEVVLEGADGTFGSYAVEPGHVVMQCHGIEEVANPAGSTCASVNGLV